MRSLEEIRTLPEHYKWQSEVNTGVEDAANSKQVTKKKKNLNQFSLTQVTGLERKEKKTEVNWILCELS